MKEAILTIRKLLGNKGELYYINKKVNDFIRGIRQITEETITFLEVNLISTKEALNKIRTM